MRIIAGRARGVQLASLAGDATRPTLGRAKEGVFSSIHFLLPGAAVLDLYAGSGQLGLEALSRGAARCVFVDEAADAVRIIRQNVALCGFAAEARVERTSAAAYVARAAGQFDVVFLDPPFASGEFPGILADLARICRPGAAVLCESPSGAEMPARAGSLLLGKTYRYGTVKISRYTPDAGVPGEPDSMGGI